MYELSVSLSDIQNVDREDKEILKKKIILQTKKSLVGMCFTKIVEYLAKTDPEAYEVFKQINAYDDKLFQSSINVLS